MVKYKEIYGVAKEKMSDVKTALNLATHVNVGACAQIKTANK